MPTDSLVPPCLPESAGGSRDSAAPVVETIYGPVEGFWRGEGETRSAAFLGIPFAKPPVRELRFAAPQPPVPWTDTRPAVSYGATPLLKEIPGSLIPEPAFPGEDTLNVNVFTPNPTAKEKLPVLVWIHGGGYNAGSPSGPWYDGATFNRDGVVTVALSYRLGFTGFGWIEGTVQNRGVLDWLAGLRWVRDNIEAFGGDPGRVTIAGQSAGGGAVLTLLGMEEAQPLFNQAFSISGAVGDVEAKRAKDFAAKLASAAGVTNNLAGFQEVPEEKLVALEEQLASISGPRDAFRVLKEPLAMGPVIDGEVVKTATLESIAKGIGKDKPLVLGSADDEFTSAMTSFQTILKLVPRRLLFSVVGLKGSTYRQYVSANGAVARKGNAYLLGRLITDNIFRALVLRTAMLRGQGPTWVYQFRYPQPETGLSTHCLDLPFWFDCLQAEKAEQLTGKNAPQTLATKMHADVIQFITQGDPGWQPWSTSTVAAVFSEDDLGTYSSTAYDEVRALLR